MLLARIASLVTFDWSLQVPRRRAGRGEVTTASLFKPTGQAVLRPYKSRPAEHMDGKATRQWGWDVWVGSRGRPCAGLCERARRSFVRQERRAGLLCRETKVLHRAAFTRGRISLIEWRAPPSPTLELRVADRPPAGRLFAWCAPLARNSLAKYAPLLVRTIHVQKRRSNAAFEDRKKDSARDHGPNHTNRVILTAD